MYVVSDAAPVAGLPEGLYDWPAGKKVLVLSDGSVCDPENECFAGSGSTMMHCMNHLSGLGLCTLDELLQVGFFNQLKLLGIDPKVIIDANAGRAQLFWDEDTHHFSSKVCSV